MGLFDTLKKVVNSEVKHAINSSAHNAINDISKGISKTVSEVIDNKSEKISFASLPKNLSELQALKESSLDTPFKTAALAMAVLCNYENDANATFEMLDFLKGPESVNEFEKQFFSDRLKGKAYKPFSFFEGATAENGYKPSVPYTIVVSDNKYSYTDEVWATLYVKSAGADSKEPIKLRKKPSTGQWFINDIQCLTDIRIPVADDPWA